MTPLRFIRAILGFFFNTSAMLEYSEHAVICLLALYFLFSWPDQLLSWGMPADVRGWDTGVN